MNKQDLNEIGTLIDQKLDEKLEPIHRKLDEHSVKLDEHSVKLDEHSVKLDSLTLDMIHVQKKTDVLKDIQSYMEGTREKVDDHEQRIQNLENAA